MMATKQRLRLASRSMALGIASLSMRAAKSSEGRTRSPSSGRSSMSTLTFIFGSLGRARGGVRRRHKPVVFDQCGGKTRWKSSTQQNQVAASAIGYLLELRSQGMVWGRVKGWRRIGLVEARGAAS